MGKIADQFGRLPDGDRVRLALGELVDDDGLIPAWRARDAFLMALMKVASEPLEELIATPEIVEKYTALVSALMRISTDDSTKADINMNVSAYIDSVERWAGDWNLTGDWIIEYAAAVHTRITKQARALPRDEDGTVRFSLPAGIFPSMIDQHVGAIVNAPINHPRLLFGGKPVGPDPDETYWPLTVFDADEDFDFEWNPWLESKADNMKTAVAWFKARYRAAQDAREKEAGGRRPGRTDSRRFEHFEWAARYQVLRHTFAAIARDAGRSRQAVTEAVYEVLALVDLQPREPDRPGPKRQASATGEKPDISN